MSNQSISSSEFQRFQDQLIFLKEAKYKTEEKCEYLIRNQNYLESKCLQLEKDLAKANDLKSKFRSAKDMDILMNENQVLRDRLSTIEGNFKLQNDIIRTECENLLSENERLKSQIETYKTSQPQIDEGCRSEDINLDSTDHQDHQYKIRYLQHEVTKLLEEKTVIELKNQALQIDLNRLKDSENELISRIDSLLNEKNKLSNQLNQIKEEYELQSNRNREEISKLTDQYEMSIDSLKNESESRLKSLEEELNEKHSKQNQAIEDRYAEQREEAERQWMEKTNRYEEQIAELEQTTEQLRIDRDAQIAAAELEKQRLEANAQFAEEELKVIGRKSELRLRDVKRQLEREVRLCQEARTRLEEVVSTQAGSQCCRSSSTHNTDDQSSLRSDQFATTRSDTSPGNSISVTDDELKNLLDRFTTVQNDLCENKRFIESLKSDKQQLIKTIDQQQQIILNYIKNRGGNDSDSSSDDLKRSHSTSEALILNGIMSSPQISNFNLHSLVNKVKDSLKSISSKDFSYSGDKSVCRVTTAEVKQLQRVCEELMMRCLNLESDLQLALDLNAQLQARLNPA